MAGTETDNPSTGTTTDPTPNSTARLQRALTRFHSYVFDYGPSAPVTTAQCCGPTGSATPCTCVPLNEVVINIVGTASDALTRFTDETYNLTIGIQDGSSRSAPHTLSHAGVQKLEAMRDQHLVNELNATTIYGAMRGLLTLSQLVQFNLTSATYTLFGVSVHDSPRFEYRGVMVDTSRNFVSLNEIQTVCDLMEQNKLNALQSAGTPS